MTCEIALFDSARLRVLDGTIDLNTHTFKASLLADTFVPISAAAWVPAQNYLLGDIVLSSAGQYIEAVTPGKSSGTEPTFDPLRGTMTSDNTVVWLNWGLTPPSTYALWSEISAHELSGGGYPAGGVALASPTLTLDRRKVTWSVGDIDFGTFTGSPKYVAIRREGSEGGVVNPLVAYLLLDSTGANITLTTDNPFTLAVPSAGLLTFA